MNFDAGIINGQIKDLSAYGNDATVKGNPKILKGGYPVRPTNGSGSTNCSSPDYYHEEVSNP